MVLESFRALRVEKFYVVYDKIDSSSSTVTTGFDSYTHDAQMKQENVSKIPKP